MQHLGLVHVGVYSEMLRTQSPYQAGVHCLPKRILRGRLCMASLLSWMLTFVIAECGAEAAEVFSRQRVEPG